MAGSSFYIAMFITLIVDIILYSIYPVINKQEPTLGGLTFFYWYQIVMLGVSSVLFFGVAYATKRGGK